MDIPVIFSIKRTLGVLSLLIGLSSTAWAQSGDFLVEMVDIRGAAYVDPSGKQILVRRQPIRFAVKLTNTSGNTQQVYVDKRSGAVKAISFDVIDEKGGRTTIKQKKEFASSAMWVSRHIPPEKSASLSIDLNSEEWENYEFVAAGEERRLKVRVIVTNKSKRYSSMEYDVVVSPRPPPAEFADPKKKAPKEVPPIVVID